MKNFIFFLVLVFGGLFAAVVLRKNSGTESDSKAILKIYASSSFIAQWGPGPHLKEAFEKDCDCRVEFKDGADSMVLMQRLRTEGRTGGADVVLGFDQFDIELAQQGIEWRKVNTSDIEFEDNLKTSLARSPLVPYDWSMLTFVVRKSEIPNPPRKLNDLLNPDYRGQIVLEDPRTSSPGLQFLLWLIQVKGEEKAFQFLKDLNPQIHSYAPSWSTAYGLFQKAAAKMTYSYVTSPVYHWVEDKTNDIIAVDFEEGLPTQVEFAGIPATCHNCELADKFIQFILSKPGQKIIMEKNYMFPVIKAVRLGTVFAEVPTYTSLEMTVIPTLGDRERIQKKWAALRRGD